MAQYGDRHINIKSRGGQDICLEGEFGIVKLTIGDGIFDHETVWIDEHEIAALAAWMLGWVKAKAQARAEAIENHPSSETWTPEKVEKFSGHMAPRWSPRDAGSLGS